MRYVAVMMAMFLTMAAGTAGAQPDVEKKAVVQVITDAYIDGVHVSPDTAAMRRGFHPDFRMLVLADGKMSAVTLDEWVARLEKAAANRAQARPAVKAEIPQVHVTGTVASAQVEIFRDGKHTFTDQLLLYKLADGWKIVSKAFYTHPR